MSLINLYQIAEIAGQEYATVRNFRYRYKDFPKPAEIRPAAKGKGGAPEFLYKKDEIESFLASKEHLKVNRAKPGNGLDLTIASAFIRAR